jgi:hypothetical protein
MPSAHQLDPTALSSPVEAKVPVGQPRLVVVDTVPGERCMGIVVLESYTGWVVHQKGLELRIEAVEQDNHSLYSRNVSLNIRSIRGRIRSDICWFHKDLGCCSYGSKYYGTLTLPLRSCTFHAIELAIQF